MSKMVNIESENPARQLRLIDTTSGQEEVAQTNGDKKKSKSAFFCEFIVRF